MSATNNYLTVLQGFEQDLPELGRSNKDGYRSVSSSGKSTAATIAPQFLVCGESVSLEEKASQTLGREEIQNRRRNTNKPATDLGQQFSLESEADVVEASAIYVLAEVYEILNTLYPGRWRRLSETTNAKLSKGDKGDVENVRYDLLFESTDEPAKTIAILEYKKVDMIAYDDFEASLTDGNSVNEELKNTSDKKILLKRNGNVFSKQVKAYSNSRQNCRHVALFNWDHLLLYDFSGANERCANLIWASERDYKHPYVNKCHIRKVLLGWILGAFEDYFGF
jgi:hypothetical protein